MTEEEIKNLKIGDKFTVVWTVQETYKNGETLPILAVMKDGANRIISKGILKNATLVKPAPKFEVGDTVRIIPDPLTGTVYGNGSLYGNWVLGEARILKETARATEMKLAKLDGPIVTLNIHCLELVKKAVKDKYYVHDLESMGDVIIAVSTMDGETVAKYIPTTHPNAKAAAKAECDRLNELVREKRKNHE